MEDLNATSTYSWRSWPARERPGTLLLVLPVSAAALAAVYLLARDAAWVILGAALLGAGLREYFLPVRYAIDEEGISARYFFWTRRRAWKTVRRIVPQKAGVFLSPFPAPTRLEAYRGFYLRCGGNRTEIIRRIEALTKHQAEGGQ